MKKRKNEFSESTHLYVRENMRSLQNPQIGIAMTVKRKTEKYTI
jgi:hypothetical protein